MIGIEELDADVSNISLKRGAGVKSLDITTLAEKTLDLGDDGSSFDWRVIVVDVDDHLAFVVTGLAWVRTVVACVRLSSHWHDGGEGQN